MPVVKVGAKYDQAKKDSEIKPIPDAVYKLRVENIEQTVTGEKAANPGRPMLVVHFVTVEAPVKEHNNRKLRYYMVLAHEGLTTGLGNIVAFTKACGKPWDGDSLKTEDYLGKVIPANIGRQKNDDRYNEIKSFVG